MELSRVALSRRALGLALAALCAAGAASGAAAGQACQTVQPSPVAVQSGLELAKRTYDALEASGAEIAVVARVGQDLSQYGLHYSHLGFVWRDHPDGRWTVVHLLNECGTAHADLYDQGLGDFFLDSPVEYRALIMLPSPSVQARLVERLKAHRERQLFSARYNVVSYPYDTDDENCIQWALEFYAAALARDVDLADRRAAQAWLLAAGYRPTTLHISALERLGADFARVDVRFAGQPFDRRMGGLIDTSTVESMEAFMQRVDPQMREMTVTLPPGQSGRDAGAAALANGPS